MQLWSFFNKALVFCGRLSFYFSLTSVIETTVKLFLPEYLITSPHSHIKLSLCTWDPWSVIWGLEERIRLYTWYWELGGRESKFFCFFFQRKFWTLGEKGLQCYYVFGGQLFSWRKNSSGQLLLNARSVFSHLSDCLDTSFSIQLFSRKYFPLKASSFSWECYVIK